LLELELYLLSLLRETFLLEILFHFSACHLYLSVNVAGQRHGDLFIVGGLKAVFEPAHGKEFSFQELLCAFQTIKALKKELRLMSKILFQSDGLDCSDVVVAGPLNEV
jgi:hypothetical protein